MQAIKRLEKNWATIFQVIIIGCYTLFIILDIIVVVIDAGTGRTNKSNFTEGMDTFLVIAQAVVDLIVLILFVALFVKFLILIHDRYKMLRC